MKALNILLLLLILKSAISFSQVSVTLTGKQPYSVIATNYLGEAEVITATVKNNYNAAIDLKAYVRIIGPYNIIIESEMPTCNIELDAKETKRFNKNNFDELCLNFNEFEINNILYNSTMSQEQKEALIVYRILPEGVYEYCLSLKNADTNQDEVTTCIDLNINHPERPTLISPSHELNINSNVTVQLNVTWSHVINDLELRKGTKYNVKIVSLGDNIENDGQFPTIDQATIVMDDPNVPPFEVAEDIPYSTFLSSFNINALPFINQHYYAVRVTAVNDDYPYLPESSQSNIHIFYYYEPDENCGESFEALPNFPMTDEVIPFTSFANIIQMQPYCDEYRSIKFDSEVKNSISGVLANKYLRTISWANGPKASLAKYMTIPEPQDYYASHISFVDYNNLPTYERGQSYFWNGNGYIKMRNKINFTLSNVSFTTGMPTMQMQLPQSADTISPGTVNLLAIHNKIPTRPLPPFKVKQIDDQNEKDYDEMFVKEVGIIQIAKDKAFETVIFASVNAISKSDVEYIATDNSRKYDQDRFITDVYKTVEHNVNITELGKYYWRIGWMKSPILELTNDGAFNIHQDALYHISIDSFVVGHKSATNTPIANNNNQNQNDECYSPCQLPEVANKNNLVGAVGDTLKIGKFKMKINEINKVGDMYNGNGLIDIPFIKEMKLEVVFNNIKVNTDKVIYEGSVKGKQGGNTLESLNSLITGQEVELPFGWDSSVKGVKLTLAFTDYTFSPTQAFAEVNFNTKEILSLIHPSELYPVLSTQICVSPKGFANDLLFHTVNNTTYQPNESGYGFSITGGQNLSDTISMTYFRFDCNGFHSMQLAGEVILSQDIFLKDSGLTSDDKPRNESVKGAFKGKFVKEGKDLMIAATMQDFQFADYLEGWGFDVDTFYIDFSDTKNPPNFEAPEGYSVSYFNNPQTANTWKGLYIPKIKVLTPKDFVNPNRSTFGLTSMIMGDGIYYLRHRAFNVVNEGIMGNMRATVDTVDAVVSNIDFRFKLGGKILLPFVKDGGYLAYSGLYNEISDWNFTMKVGTDSLDVDLWKAYLRLYENSFFFMGRDTIEDRFYIKTIVNGHISISDKLLPPNGLKGLKNINAARLEFENLGYKSREGILGGAVFKKASPQKTVNGFPIQLDSIAFTNYQGNPGLYFRPKVVFVGEEDGFSASAGMIFYGKFNTSGPLDYFNDMDVFLSDVNIDIAVSSCTFKGYVKFIDKIGEKGFEGMLDAKFPTGIGGKFVAKFVNVTSNPNAAFGTAGNYNAFYVDALIAFGKAGIPVFAGVNMYGVGGGLWYNMYQDTTYKIKPSSLYQEQATSSNTASNSPIPYTNKFGGGYGIKLQGLFGDPNGGEKLNMLLALSAQFPQSGGPIIKFRGDVNIMSKIEDIGDDGKVNTTKKALWGHVLIEYNGQEDFVHAEMVMKAKMTYDNKIILRGRLDDFKVVDAQFHSKTEGSSEWYLYVGTPEDRGGILLDAKVFSLEADAYFMMGHGVPNILPTPDQEFMTMLENQNEGYTSGQGSLSNVLSKSTIVGRGIAFGSAIKLIDTFKYQPFYLNIKLIMGFDFNLTESDRECLETGEAPGHNGWYATGQLYAGLKGEFGIHIDLWFIECDKTLFNGSVATIMSGGTPNPSWFVCKGTLKYEIVGLVRGSHSFKLEVGQKCTIGNGNPFSDMEIITDTSPKKDDTEVSVFTDPTVSYAFPIDETLEFPVNENEIAAFRLYIKSYSLKNVVKETSYTISQSLINDNFISLHTPTSYLAGLTKHTMKIIVQAKRSMNGGTFVDIKNEDGSLWSESRIINFTTAKTPDSIPASEVVLSYPLQGQRYFLKGETENNSNKGFIKLRKQFAEVLYTTDNGKNYKYILEYKYGNNIIIKEPVTVSNFQVLTFNVNQLPNSTTFLSLLKRERDYGNGLHSQIPTNLSMMQANSSTYQVNNANAQYEILPAKMVTLGSSAVSDKEKTLYKFIFKTSKHNTFKEKYDEFVWSEPSLSSTFIQDIKFNVAGMTEDFDEYDIIGFSNSNSNKISLVDAGVFYSFGENYGNIEDFNYLGNDKIITQVDKDYFHTCRAYNGWRDQLTNPLKTRVQNLTQGLGYFKYRMDHLTMVNFSYTRVQELLSIPTPSSSGAMMLPANAGFATATSGAPAPLPRSLRLKIQYGIQGLGLTAQNQYLMMNHLQKIGTILQANKPSLYNSANSFVNSPLSFYINVCQDAKVGFIYRIPSYTNRKKK